MAKLEQKARKGLYGGFKPGSTGGPGTGKFKNTVKRISNNVKRKAGDVVSNVKDKIETRKTEKATEELAAEGSSKNPRFLQDALNPAQNAAMTAGGSRPMTAMDNPQIDLVTGMPITPGGQPNMNPNFIGGMPNSNMPTTGMLAQEKSVFENLKEFGRGVMGDLEKADSLTKNMLDKAALKVGILNEDEYAKRVYDPNKRQTKVPQEKYDAAKADLNNNGVTEDWEKAKAEKFTVAQEKKMMRTMKPLPEAVPDKTDSVVMYMGGNAPGQYNNPFYKPAADSAKVRFPNIDADKIKQSDIYTSGDPLHSITKHIPIANKRYKIGQDKKERKSMRVKRGK